MLSEALWPALTQLCLLPPQYWLHHRFRISFDLFYALPDDGHNERIYKTLKLSKKN